VRKNVVSISCKESALLSLDTNNQRPRARETGLVPGKMMPGPLNSITDVPGLRVGHETLIRGKDIRTGVTAILPHGGNIFQERVPAAIFVGNGFGKLVGSTQVNELGEIETPILLTNTLCVGRAADALVDYVLSMPENAEVMSVNPVVGETNDGFLNDIRSKHIGREEVFRALSNAKAGPVEEGCVGAGTGTCALGFKGGIGTSSRRLRGDLDRYTVGVLVQSNFGGDLHIGGVPVWKELKVRHGGDEAASNGLVKQSTRGNQESGSVMVIIGTDAPLRFRSLYRLAARSSLGLGRTGAIGANHSGDYFIAFCTARRLRTGPSSKRLGGVELANDVMDPLFSGVVEATEEAVYNSLFRATTMKGRANHVARALPIELTKQILERAHMI
jgi:D-aminopeptidase